MSSKLICIAGMDGTGKSTLVKGLHQHFPDAAVAEIWDLLRQERSTLFISKRDVDNYLSTLTPDSRLLFLAHAMKYALDKAMNASRVLINAYLYKYFAAELAYGADRTLVRKIIEAMPVPDVVICLKLNPAAIAVRKDRFTRYECGFAAEPSPEKFIAFQERVAEEWKIFDQSKWEMVDAGAAPEELVQQSLKLIVR